MKNIVLTSLAMLLCLVVPSEASQSTHSTTLQKVTYSMGEERIYSPDQKIFYGSRFFLAKTTEDRGTIEVSERFHDRGYVGEKAFFDASGQVTARMKVDMKKISEETYRVLYERLSKQP